MIDGLLAVVREHAVPLEGLLDLAHALEPAVPGPRTSGTRRERAASDAAARLLGEATGLGVPPAHALRLLAHVERRLLRGPLAERAAATRELLSALVPFGEWGLALHLLRSWSPPKDDPAAEVAAAIGAFLSRFPPGEGGLSRAVAALAAAEASGESPGRRHG